MSMHLEEFYGAIGASTHQFQRAMDEKFIGTLTKWRIMGGASTSERKAAIQIAVDSLKIYGALGHHDAAMKTQIFERVFRKHYPSEKLPNPTADIRTRADNMKTIEAKYNVIMAKFMLLDYWESVGSGTSNARVKDGDRHWSLHYLLNYDPLKVRPILEVLVGDAKNMMAKKHFTGKLEAWRGASATSKVEFTKDSMMSAIKAEATAKVGASINGEFEVSYTGFKLKGEGEAFVGARAKAQFEGKKYASAFEAKGSAEVEVGIRITGKLNVDVLDILEAEAGFDALAGAMAKAEVELEYGPTRIKAKVGAEAFAGVRITGEAKSTLKIGGRPILSATAKGSLSAGVGASASAGFECDIFGKVSVSAKAGLTAGVGAEGETELGVDFHNLGWGATNLFWYCINELGFKNKGKVWFLPVEENVAMARRVRDAMFEMLGDLYKANEEELKRLGDWKVLESRVADAVAARNPRVQTLQRQNASRRLV